MATAASRGRGAERPSQIPRAGWRDILIRTWHEIGNDHLSLIAAGIGFYALLALFPGIAAMVAIWGLALDPQQLEQQIATISQLLPEQAAAIVTDQARKVAAGGGGLGLAAAAGILLAIYSASKGTKALIEGLNIIYEEEEKRGFIRLNFMALAITLGVIVALIVALGLIVIVPIVLEFVGLGPIVDVLVSILRWPILFAGALVVLAALYRLAPSRAAARWRWVTPGAAVATVIWVLGSIAFSIYVRNFGSYNETYGSIGAVIILLMWLWLSAFVVLLGAEVNAEMEHQTERDSTTGAPQPRGRRGARVADEVAESP
jgi:membrane protein